MGERIRRASRPAKRNVRLTRSGLRAGHFRFFDVSSGKLARNPKAEEPKSEIETKRMLSIESVLDGRIVRISGIRISFGIRISVFGFHRRLPRKSSKNLISPP